MNQRFIIFRRSGVFYCEDRQTGKQTSLRTRDEGEALTLLHAKNEATRQPILNLQIARAYLTASDPAMAERTWQTVMNQMQTQGKETTQKRYVRAMKAKAFDGLRERKLVETTAEDFLRVLNGGQSSVLHFLRRLHNLALALGWIPLPVLAPKLWPKPQAEPKRGITMEEHQAIIAAEKSAERNLYYQLLWEIGSAQSDAAALTVENIDRETNTLVFHRMKTGELCRMAISSKLKLILEQLPTEGPLFPNICATDANLRASEFYYLCKRLKISGVTLHSYRYAWAERARAAGFPERFAQEALGHNSKAVHRAYAKGAQVTIPSLEEYEKRRRDGA